MVAIWTVAESDIATSTGVSLVFPSRKSVLSELLGLVYPYDYFSRKSMPRPAQAQVIPNYHAVSVPGYYI
jgi:hypothetical protein